MLTITDITQWIDNDEGLYNGLGLFDRWKGVDMLNPTALLRHNIDRAMLAAIDRRL